MWNRRHTTKFNGASYPVQCAAAACYTPEGQAQIKEKTDYYLGNAAIIKKAIVDLGYSCTGGDNSPYVWVNTKTDSWAFFDRLLHECGIVCTPGSGFGSCGQGYVRFSAFNSRENTQKAMEKLSKLLR
jgi:LL-diaminopimelate aminotransferase